MLSAAFFRPRFIAETLSGVPLVAGCRVAPGDVPAPDAATWLTADEGQRAAAMRGDRRRAQFIAGRWLLRRVAGELFGDAGYVLETSADRPFLRTRDGSSASCSVSHSGNVVVCAAGRVVACGIDVERVRPRSDWNALCERVLHPAERRRLAQLNDAARWRGFYDFWVVKEAVAKALGIGLAFPFAALCIADGRIRETPPGYGLEDAAWRVCALDVGPGMAAALAWRTD
jgi:4'-phosphopantetheinyl transferase